MPKIWYNTYKYGKLNFVIKKHLTKPSLLIINGGEYGIFI